MEKNSRVEQNVMECYDEEIKTFDWDTYQYLCDIGDYWNVEE